MAFGDMGQHAGLGGDVVLLAHLVQHLHQRDARRDVVGGRVYADDGVADAVEQAIEHGGGDAAGIIRRVVGLQARAEAAGQAERVAEGLDDATLAETAMRS